MASPAPPPLATIYFSVIASSELNETLCVGGERAELGSWDADWAVALWTDPEHYPLWTGVVQLQLECSNAPIEFRLVKRRLDHTAVWEPLDSRRLHVSPGSHVAVRCRFGEPEVKSTAPDGDATAATRHWLSLMQAGAGYPPVASPPSPLTLFTRRRQPGDRYSPPVSIRPFDTAPDPPSSPSTQPCGSVGATPSVSSLASDPSPPAAPAAPAPARPSSPGCPAPLPPSPPPPDAGPCALPTSPPPVPVAPLPSPLRQPAAVSMVQSPQKPQGSPPRPQKAAGPEASPPRPLRVPALALHKCETGATASLKMSPRGGRPPPPPLTAPALPKRFDLNAATEQTPLLRPPPLTSDKYAPIIPPEHDVSFFSVVCGCCCPVG